MAFHRLTTPSYFGGLPVGYDLINGSAPPAAADGAKVGGPNAGTYFHAFGDPATSSNWNRPSKALSENTDHLDDLLHRDLAVLHKTDDVVAGAPVSTIVLPAGTFLGGAGIVDSAETHALLFDLLDNGDFPVLDAANEEILIASLTLSGGDAVGGGFSANTVTLNLTTPIPAAQTYRVYYGIRSSLATLGQETLFMRRVVTAAAVSYAGGFLWADASTNPATSVEGQLDKIISDLGGVDGAKKIGNAGVLNAANAWTAANTFEDISVTGAGRYKLASQSITRMTQDDGRPLVPASWALGGGGIWVCTTATPSALLFNLDVPDGATLTGVSISLKGAPGHSAPPETEPTFVLSKQHYATDVVTASPGLIGVDAVTDLGVYEVNHDLAVSGLSEVIDRATYRYSVILTTEGDANALPGQRVGSVRMIYTISTMDPG